MTPTKLLIGQILIVFAIVLAGVWAATQWAAAMLGYQPRARRALVPARRDAGLPALGALRLVVSLRRLCARTCSTRPGTLAGGERLRRLRRGDLRLALARAPVAQRHDLWLGALGDARARSSAPGCSRDAGVFLGRLDGRYLRHDGPEHVMAFAPTRSGKGVGLVVPTLLSWTGSAVVHDIKGENWQLTAGWRSRFSHCLLFNPTDARSARYNPLLEVRRGAHEVRDVQNIADILVDPEGALERRNHWEKTSHSLLVGAILHVLYAEEEKTLARVATFLSDPARPFAATLRRMMATNHLGTADAPMVHPVVASAAREVLNKSENERSGVLSTAMSFLGLYRDPTVAAVTSRCDWRIADLVDGERPVSLYLVVPPSDISRTKPLIRLVLNQIGRRLTERLDSRARAERRHQLLLMLDEFPALGRLDFFETALAFMAGYGIRAFLIAQSPQPDREGLWREQRHPRQLPCPRRLRDQRRAHRQAHLRRARHRDRAARDAQLCRPPARALARPCHGQPAGDRAAAADARRGDAAAARPTSWCWSPGLAPIRAKKLRYYEDRNFTARVAAAAGARRRRLCRPARAARATTGAAACARTDRAARRRGRRSRRRRATRAACSRQRHPGLGRGAGRRRAEPVQPIRSGSTTTTPMPPPTSARWTRRAASAPSPRAYAINEGAAARPRPAAGLLTMRDARSATSSSSPEDLSDAARGARGEARRVQVGDPRRRARPPGSTAAAPRARRPLRPAARPDLDARSAGSSATAHVLLETLALFVRYQLTINAPLAGRRPGGARGRPRALRRPSSRRSAASSPAGTARSMPRRSRGGRHR